MIDVVIGIWALALTLAIIGVSTLLAVTSNRITAFEAALNAFEAALTSRELELDNDIQPRLDWIDRDISEHTTDINSLQTELADLADDVSDLNGE